MSQQPHQPEIGLKKADIKQVNANQGVTILFESPPKKKKKLNKGSAKLDDISTENAISISQFQKTIWFRTI